MRMLVFAGSLIIAGYSSLFSQAATEPQGVFEFEFIGNSDTIFSIPVTRSPAFVGLVDSVSGSTITVKGTPAWETSPQEFVYDSETQTNTYYAVFGSGARNGMYYIIESNTADTITVDLAGDTLEGNVVTDDSIRIFPFWTFNTLFPQGEGIPTSDSLGSPDGLILIPTESDSINQGSSAQYFYYTGSSFGGEGWRRITADPPTPPTQIVNDDVILPDHYVTIRNRTDSPTTAVVSGPVIQTDFSTILMDSASGERDNAVGFNVPIPVSLAESNLIESGAFESSPSLGSPVDLLFVYDQTTPGFNKGSSAIYFHYSGSSFGGPGWRKITNPPTPPTTIVDGEDVFQPGQGVVIRKGGGTGSSAIWNLTPSYQ